MDELRYVALVRKEEGPLAELNNQGRGVC